MTKSTNRQRKPTTKASQSAPGTANRNKRYSERQAALQEAALQARRRRNQLLGIGSIAMVVVVVVVLVVVKLAGGGNTPTTGGSATSPPAGTPIAASVTGKLISVPLSALATAPASGLSTSPEAISDPKLKVDGKPDLLYVGAEFCPVCATERWAMYVALSKFGTFSPQPGRIHSALRDGDIQTVTFYKTTYTSPYFTFTPKELTTNIPEGNSYTPLERLSAAQQELWQSHTTGFPWLDFGGKMQLTSAQFDPTELEGLTFDAIADSIGRNSTATGANIDASAKVLVQTICSTLTDNRPADVCSAVAHG
jgi:hypothetical protein